MNINCSLILTEEHGVIIKMIGFLEDSIEHLKEVKEKKEDFFDVVIDFFRIFADKAHHGKEEFIFFKKLEEKPLSTEEKKLLSELIEEHKLGRLLISDLEKRKDFNDFTQIEEILKKLVKLYKNHIKKENINFFPPAFKYLSDQEKKGMLLNFYEADHRVFFNKYKKIVEDLKAIK